MTIPTPPPVAPAGAPRAGTAAQVPPAPAGPSTAPTATIPTPPPGPAAPPRVVSCKSCVFYIEPTNGEQQQKISGRISTASAICGRFSRVLATANSVADQDFTNSQLTQIGSRCTQYEAPQGVEPQGKIETTETMVMLGNPVSHNLQAVDSQRAPSCVRCIFYVSDGDMMQEFGVMANGCRLKNSIIPNGKAAAIASQCADGVDIDADHGRNNAQIFDTYTLTVYPHLRAPDHNVQSDPDDDDDNNNPAPRRRGRPRRNDPTTAELEPASDEDREIGIRGWRKVVDADNNSRSVLLPVFDPQFFSDAERAKIPMTGDDEHPENYIDHQNLLYKTGCIWRELNETPALNGISGVGKTEFFRYMAWICSMPFERISISNSTELDDLAGKMILESDEQGNTVTKFEYGRIPKAWAKPCVIVIDEPNVGPPDVWQFLRPLTDNSKQLVLDVNKGERISRNPHCYMGMAFNPTWDMRNVGTHEISDADGSRLMHLSIPAPTDALERRIIKERCKDDGYDIPADTLDQIMGIARDIRALAPQDFPIHWGVRQQIKVSRATRVFNMLDCYRMAAADLLEPDDREQIYQAVRAHVPDATPRRGRPRNN